MIGGLYEVIGRRSYRGHQHGERFFAKLGRHEEHRAVLRGAIKLLDRTTPSLSQVTYSLPQGWTKTTKEER